MLRQPPIGELVIGEPDANVEQYQALRTHEEPNFIRLYYPIPNFDLQTFLRGEKTFLLGQKGTGKTAILRKLHSEVLASGMEAEFIVFKSTILEETELLDVGTLPVLDDREVVRSKHYYHVLKRLVLLIVYSKLSSSAETDEDSDVDPADKSLLKRVVGSNIFDVIRLGFESVFDIVKSVKIDPTGALGGNSSIDQGRFIKKSNDSLNRYILRRAASQDLKLRIFFDEVHFAYRSDESLRNDAMLVRDLLHVCSGLNTAFAERKLDIVLFAAVRSEFLQHPIIKEADIVHSVESAAYSVGWHEYNYNMKHPLFEFVQKRLVSRDGLQNADPLAFLANIPIIDFLEHTWAKPRDFVRFFKCLQELFPRQNSFSYPQVKTALNKYSEAAWEELESGAAAFIPEKGREELTNVLKSLIPAMLDGSSKMAHADFIRKMKPVYEKSSTADSKLYSFKHFVQLLYVLGLYSTEKSDAKGQTIIHSYHRGNRFPQEDGVVKIHRAILLAFG